MKRVTQRAIVYVCLIGAAIAQGAGAVELRIAPGSTGPTIAPPVTRGAASGVRRADASAHLSETVRPARPSSHLGPQYRRTQGEIDRDAAERRRGRAATSSSASER